MSFLSIAKTILSSMFRKPSTIEYPLKPKQNYPIVRGRVENEIEKCIFCGICQKKCPTGAITVKRDVKSWTIERFDCIQCCSCVESCPKKCLDMSSELTKASETQTKDTKIGA